MILGQLYITTMKIENKVLHDRLVYVCIRSLDGIKVT